MDSTSIPFDQFLDIALARAEQLRAMGVSKIKYGEHELTIELPIVIQGEKVDPDAATTTYRRLPKSILDDPDTFPRGMPSYPRGSGMEE